MCWLRPSFPYGIARQWAALMVWWDRCSRVRPYSFSPARLSPCRFSYRLSWCFGCWGTGNCIVSTGEDPETVRYNTAMKARVTSKGLNIPKRLLAKVSEVENRKKNGVIVVTPTGKDDPIWNLGKEPVSSDITDASENHDRYIYGS